MFKIIDYPNFYLKTRKSDIYSKVPKFSDDLTRINQKPEPNII